MEPEVLAAEFYDAMVEDWPGEIDFYRALARPKARVLEVACGTGRVTLRLAAEGMECVGFDVSPAMLAVARRKTKHLGRVEWIEADMKSFDLGRAFDLILVPGHSFQFMLSTSDQLSCLRSIRRHVAPDGRAVIHIDHQDLSWLAGLNADPEQTFEPPAPVRLQDGRLFHVSKRWSYDPVGQTASVVTRYAELGPEGAVIAQSTRGPVQLHCYFRFEIEHLLARAGLAVESLYGDFSPSGLTAQSTEMIWLLKAEAKTSVL